MRDLKECWCGKGALLCTDEVRGRTYSTTFAIRKGPLGVPAIVPADLCDWLESARLCTKI